MFILLCCRYGYMNTLYTAVLTYKTATIPMKRWKKTRFYIPYKGRVVLLNTMDVYGGMEI